MSNQTLFKFGYAAMDPASARVIDTNDIMQQRLQQLREKANEDPAQFEDAQFPNHLEATEVAKLLADSDETGEDGFTEGLAAEKISAFDEKAAAIVQKAQEEAQQILEDARVQAESIKESARSFGHEEGRKAGYQDGKIQTTTELENEKARLEEERQRLEAEYEARLNEMEPLLVDALTDIYEHIIHVTLADKKDFIVKLLSDTIRKVEGVKDFIVHVSREDYEYVKEQKEELMQAPASVSATVEVIEDYSLASGECMIETDGGIYDCSLDVQLSALKEQIRLLSFHRE